MKSVAVGAGTIATRKKSTRSIIVFAPRPLSFLIHPIGAPSQPSTGDVVIEPGDDIDLRLNGGRAVLTKRPQ